jgi:putative polyhydroxyalkanoate system protein
MATIRIDRPHHMSQRDAKALAERLACDFEKRFELVWRWDGDAIHFERRGATGQMQVGPTNLLLVVRLGMMLAPLKPVIEKRVNAELDALDPRATRA